MGSRQRFAFVDGLRGIAACAVVLFHVSLFTLFESPAGASIPAFVQTAVGWGCYGVCVFFVISGFVIFYAIGNQQVGGRFALRFIGRRSVRLDPPYWVAIVVTLGLEWFLASRGRGEFEAPTARVVAAHLVYAQGVLDMQHLAVGIWTLCIEVQFYLFALAAAWMMQVRRARSTGAAIELLLCFVASLAVFTSIDHGPNPHALLSPDRSLLPWLCLFGLGVLPWLMLERKVSAWPMVVLLGCVAVRLVASFEKELLVGALTGVVLVAAIRRDALGRWLAAAPFQFFGRISYSLYLIHFPVTSLTKWAVHEVMAESARAGWVTYVVSLAMSIGVATGMHHALEGPCTRFARRLFAMSAEHVLGRPGVFDTPGADARGA